MTDKQIIIDGVDVSGCCFYHSNGECCTSRVWEGYCKDCRKCMYKLDQQLKAKEQECERLKNIINEAKNSKLDLNSFFAIEATVGEYQLELDQLKEQLEAYKMEAEEGKEIYAELKAENENLKQYKASKQASYESMQREWNRAVNANRELKSDNKHLNDLLNQALKELEELQNLKDEDSLRVVILARENERLKEKLGCMTS